MSHEKFIHWERYSRQDANEQTMEGFFDVIEDEYSFYVFDSYEGMVVERFDTLEAAMTHAKRLAGWREEGE